MHAPYILFLAGLAAAAPAPASPQANSAGIVLANPPNTAVNRTYTSEEVHANVMQNQPAEWIVTSDSLYQYLAANFGANHTIYVSDEQKFVNMGSVHKKEGTGGLSKRQGEGNPCFGYTNVYTTSSGAYWSAWSPAQQSPLCLYTGNSNDGGSVTIGWSTSVAYEESGGVTWSEAKEPLSLSLGFSITETFTKSSSTTCNVLANSVVQVWEQTYLGWGLFDSEGCESCDYGGGCGGQFGDNPKAIGGLTAPASNDYNLGCSTGSNHVQC